MMRPFTAYCVLLSLAGIGLNCLFLVITRMQRVERIQEVMVFLRSISVGYVFMAVALMAVAPQSITLASTNVRIPHGMLALSSAGLSSNFMNGLAAFGAGCFVFTALCFCLLFFYHYRKTAGQMSTVFAPKNVPVFLGVVMVFCLVQAVLLYYSKVDPNYLLERLSRSKKWEDLQLSLGLNPNASLLLESAPAEREHQQGAAGSGSAVSGGFQSITGGSNYSALAAAIESRQFERGGVSGGGGGTSEARLFEGSFGTDYARNPLYFLANGVMILTLAIVWAVSTSTAIIVKCKLSGRQESMSDKSQREMQAFTNMLILAYLPSLLVACAGINYIICFVMGESALPIQEFLAMLLSAPVPGLFPLTCMLFLKEFRHAAWQIMLCRIWTRNQRQQRAAAERKAQENIDEELASASRNKVRNKRMPNSDIALGEERAAAKSAGTASTGGNHPENRPGRYAETQDGNHRQARALFGKQ